jgi:hypothetical protein
MVKPVLRFWYLCFAVTVFGVGVSAAAYSQDADEPDIAMLELNKKMQQIKDKYVAIKKQQQEKQEQKNLAIIQIAKAIKSGNCEGLQAKLEKQINWFRPNPRHA